MKVLNKFVVLDDLNNDNNNRSIKSITLGNNRDEVSNDNAKEIKDSNNNFSLNYYSNSLLVQLDDGNKDFELLIEEYRFEDNT